MSSVLKLYPNGLTAGVPPRGGPKSRGTRTAVGGWSHESIRSNTRFLYSIRAKELTGIAWSFTLTVRDCPPTHRDWKKLRERFFDRLRRLLLLRGHWLTEWQLRMVPHLHGCLFFDPDGPASAQAIMEAWLSAAAAYRPAAGSQAVMPMYDAIGWFQYVSKHAARGLHHYQRSPDQIPPGWQGTTGRMWGALGEWPKSEAMAVNLDMPAFHAFRRLLRRRRIADARAEGSSRRIAHARRMLKCSEPSRSSVRGASDWCDLSESLSLLAAVGSLGHSIQS